MKRYFTIGWDFDYKDLTATTKSNREWIYITDMGKHSLESFAFDVYFDKSQKKLKRFGDIVYFLCDIFAVSKNAKNALGDILDRSGDYIPTIGLEDFYSLYRIQKEFDCLDVEKSEYNYFSSGQRARILKVAIDRNKFDQELDIFYISTLTFNPMRSGIIVSEKFVEMYEAANLTGIFFEEAILV